MDDFNELRRLLLGREQDELRELREQLADKDHQAREISGVLPDAVKLSRERGEDLTRALRPSVESAIQETIEKKPQAFVDVFFPIIGPLVRRSIAEALRGLVQSLNQTLEHTVSWQGMKWRWEAWRTGRSFAEVVMLRSLVYRVEQVFLFHRETSMSLLHVSADAAAAKDSDMIAGMLSAIQDFARDAFDMGENDALEETRIGDLNVWLALGRRAYLAAVIRGNPPRSLHTVLEEAIETVHVQRGAALADFQGDASAFEPLRPDLETCLQAQFHERDGAPKRHTAAWVAMAGAVAAVLLCLLLAWRSGVRWRAFTERLRMEPGLALTESAHRWFSDSRIAGLRDPTAADPAAIAREFGYDADDVRFDWKEYLALDATSLRRRFEHRFGIPEGAGVSFENGMVGLSGSAPYEWVERVRAGAALVPGIAEVSERDLSLTYDPALVLERFEKAWPPPPGLNTRVEAGTLVLSGSAAYEWLAPVRVAAMRIPGITKISKENLRVTFDPALVLRRFEDRFGLQDSVNATVEDGTLALSGEAPHGWLARVRAGAGDIAGIDRLDERKLTDLDLRAFTQSKSIIESAFIYFLSNKDKFATEGFAALARLPDEIRTCWQAGERIGKEVRFEVRGSADAVGDSEKNRDLSTRRANAVRDFLVTCGLDAALFQTRGIGETPDEPERFEPSGAGAARPLPEQADRCVAFRVLTSPISPRP